MGRQVRRRRHIVDYSTPPVAEIDLANPAYDPWPTPPAPTHEILPKPDADATVRKIAALLVYEGDPQRQASQIAKMIGPFGVRLDAVKIATSLAERGTTHRPNARLLEHGVKTEGIVLKTREDDLYFRAAYIANAAKRITDSLNAGNNQRDALKAERRYQVAHEEARKGRLRSAAQVRAAQGVFGDMLGWYLNPLLKNDAECIAANGHNFDANVGTVIGLPGSVHRNCGCYASAPHEGASLVNEVMGNLLPFKKSKPKFKLRKGA